MPQSQTTRDDPSAHFVSRDDDRFDLWGLVVSLVCILGAAVIVIGLAFRR